MWKGRRELNDHANSAMTDTPPIDILELALRRQHEARSRLLMVGHYMDSPEASVAYGRAHFECSLADDDVYACRRAARELAVIRL